MGRVAPGTCCVAARDGCSIQQGVGAARSSCFFQGGEKRLAPYFRRARMGTRMEFWLQIERTRNAKKYDLRLVR